jgi:tetratricopeptide (TPR) repeat protein
MLLPNLGETGMASKQWAKFPHTDKAFDYAGDKLEKNWAKLHAGDQEPFPDEAHIVRLIKGNSKLGKAADAGKIAAQLQDGWRAFHRGDFQAAFEAADAVGTLGFALACKAMGIHANYLVDDEKEKLKRFEAVAARAEAAQALLPKEANTYYFQAFALGRYSQMISIAKALSQGLAGKVRASLDTTLKLAPKHAEAQTAMALYHAEVVGKVGGMIAGLTYGAKASTAEEHLKTALKLTPDAPIAYIEQGNALMLLYGSKKEDEAAACYAKAIKLKARDAMEALDIAFAKAQME